jgi:hypothetical protein
VSKKKADEGYKVTFNFIFSDKVKPAEISLIENQLGELLKQIIREENEED